MAKLAESDPIRESILFLERASLSKVVRYYNVYNLNIERIVSEGSGQITSSKIFPKGLTIYTEGYVKGDINRSFKLLCVVQDTVIFLTTNSIYCCSEAGKPKICVTPKITALLPSLPNSLPFSLEGLEELRRLQAKKTFSTRTYIFGSSANKKVSSSDVVLTIETASETLIVTRSGSVYVFLK